MKEVVNTPKLFFLIFIHSCSYFLSRGGGKARSSVCIPYLQFSKFGYLLPTFRITSILSIHALLNDYLFYFFPSKQCVRVLNTAPTILY